MRPMHQNQSMQRILKKTSPSFSGRPELQVKFLRTQCLISSFLSYSFSSLKFCPFRNINRIREIKKFGIHFWLSLFPISKIFYAPMKLWSKIIFNCKFNEIVKKQFDSFFDITVLPGLPKGICHSHFSALNFFGAMQHMVNESST